jgi:N-acetylglucosaminyl-diphospho-decaprenol L-rhamnosyltransferase
MRGRTSSAAPGIAIITHNSAPDLRAFFPRLTMVARDLAAPIAVVDNASEDGSPLLVEELSEGHEAGVIVNRHNRGYAAAVNQAIGELGDRDVLLVNPDVEISDPGAILEMLRFMRDNPKVGVMGPRLLDSDGTTQSSARPFPNVIAMAGHASAAGRLRFAKRAAASYLRSPGVEGPARVDWVLGAAMLIRRDAFEAVGGWDERFFLYLEDTDFCLRCSGEGWETWYFPSVAMRHLHRRASDPARGGVLRSSHRRHHISSLVRFFRRNPRLIWPGAG